MHKRHGPWEWQYVSSCALRPRLGLKLTRLPSTIANLVNFVFVYNLALNCFCLVHFSLRFTLEQLTNQVGYIIVIARVARDLWQRKQTLSSGCALGLGWFTAINP